MKFKEKIEIWIQVDHITENEKQKVKKAIAGIAGEFPVILYGSVERKWDKTIGNTSIEALDELIKLYGTDNVKTRKVKIELSEADKHLALFDEIDEIKEHGFSELEAIELLKVAELRELNKQLSDTLYISGEVTAYPGRVE